MGLFGGNKQSQSTDVDEQSAGASVGGNTTAPVTSQAVTIGGSGKSPITGGTFNFTDAGSISRSFDFADATAGKGFEFAQAALDKATRAFDVSTDAISSASTQTANAYAKANETPADKDRQSSGLLMFGVLVLVGFIFYSNKGKG